MRMLAIEMASPPGSLALLDGGQLAGAASIQQPRKTTQEFAVLIRELLAEAQWRAQDVQLVATSIGPGSFTGLRIGVTAAKVFAYTVGAKNIGVNTLQVIAAQSPAEHRLIEAVIDAQRDQLFVARFERTDSGIDCIEPTHIVDAEPWLSSRDQQIVLTGTGIRKHRLALANSGTVDESLWEPRAETVGRLALTAYAQGQAIEPMKLQPEYYRKSAAEEKLDHA